MAPTTSVPFLVSIAIMFVIIIIKMKSTTTEAQKVTKTPLEVYSYAEESEIINPTPIIGVMTQNRLFSGYNEYIMCVYSKFVEQYGARIVPIPFHLTTEELEAKLDRVNGVIIPGGITPLINEQNETTDYTHHIQTVLKKSKALFEKGIHLPVFGVCLGLQGIAVAEAPYYEVLGVYEADAVNHRINLKITTHFDETRIHKGLPEALREAVQTERICYDSHHDGVRPEFFEKYEGLHDYRIVASADDKQGKEFVSLIEHKKYPIYAVQYHPEKIAFIHKPDLDLPRTTEAFALARHYALFIVTEAKKSSNVYGTPEEIQQDLMFNWKMIVDSGNSQDIYVRNTEHGIQPVQE